MAKRSKTKKLDENIQLNVNVNMTLEVAREDLKDYIGQFKWGANNAAELAEQIAEDMLDGEEINTYGGRAWICSIDDVTFINTYDENDIDKAIKDAEEAEDDD